MIALRRCQDRQKRERPNALRPGNRDQQHQTQPEQFARFHEMTVTGADGIALNAFGFDHRPVSVFDGLVDAHDQGTREGKGIY